MIIDYDHLIYRAIPFHIREKVKVELNRLQVQDIIEHVLHSEEPDWSSPAVIVSKKDDGIRLCPDMCDIVYL